MSKDELKYWIALKFVSGVGNIGYRSLMEYFGQAERIFNASISDLITVPGIGEKTAKQIKAFAEWDNVEAECLLLERHKASIITFKDHRYPRNLLNIYDYPPLLYIRGAFLEDEICVAVVGSRTASAYGRYVTERLSRELALNGVTVISGLARGIDTAAHQGALSSRGRTIAVLGCGLDYIYPPENVRLYAIIPEHGAIVTEFSFGTTPQKINFPARNRIISGMSYGVVVVEAGEKSGSLITARMALEQGREVFAVPGAIDSSGSKGTNRLIRDGAKLVESVHDILEELRPQVRSSSAGRKGESEAASVKNPYWEKKGSTLKVNLADTLEPEEKQVWESLSSTPLDIDGIMAKTGIKIGSIHNILLNLELSGLISRLPGNNYVIKGKI